MPLAEILCLKCIFNNRYYWTENITFLHPVSTLYEFKGLRENGRSTSKNSSIEGMTVIAKIKGIAVQKNIFSKFLIDIIFIIINPMAFSVNP